MSTHKSIERICCAVLVIVLLATLLFCNAERLGIQRASTVMGYETRLFDTSRVHTIEIIMDDWDGFLEECENEEYQSCSLVIDNEAYKNVAFRAKGNTSLSSVRAYGNNRYSFKIEFDHYDSGKNYYGLDKLCLNNIIQDNTYMKDYLAYTLMREGGVPAPLCSYVYITVNGEEWGLYLAVEDVEDGFLTRNYGREYGKLYKPDSMKGGGGGEPPGDFPGGENMPEGFPGFPDMGNMPQGFPNTDTEGAPENPVTVENMSVNLPGNMPPDNGGNQPPQGEPPEGVQPPQGEPFDGNQPPQGEQSSGNQPPQGQQPSDNQSPPQNDGNPTQQDAQPSENIPSNGEDSTRGGRRHGGGGPGGFGGMGSDDTKLKYIDDAPESYSNIFDSAKTDVTEADKARLIESLRKLNAKEDIESVVDTEEVIRYLTVHNFLCNGDSYTGSMVHNYYLYEKDGQLAMLPWDYNLAFGGFGEGGFGSNGGGATGTVNSPIDSPVSGDIEDRPMVAWIFADESYIEQYHQYYKEFLQRAQADDGLADTIVRTAELITPYVERDPTKFCTLAEFQTGIQTLRDFCELRLESISGQLNGTIPSTSEGQQSSTALVDASEIEISAMGSMNHGGGPGERQDGGNPGDDGQNASNPGAPNGNSQNGNNPGVPGGEGQNGGNPTAPSGSDQNGSNPAAPTGDGQNNNRPGGNPFAQPGNTDSAPQNGGILLAVSVVILLAGLLFAFKFRR